LQENPVKPSALMHSSTKLCELWHMCFDQFHYGVIHILNNLVHIFPNFKIEKKCVCRGCALGKHVKATFPSNEHRSRGSLDLINFDMCGPISSSSLIGISNYVTFIDDFSCKT